MLANGSKMAEMKVKDFDLKYISEILLLIVENCERLTNQ